MGFLWLRQSQRGRCNSLNSVLAFGWCGSAVLGGFLLDAFDFDLTFLVTAFFQVGIVLVSVGHCRVLLQQLLHASSEVA